MVTSSNFFLDVIYPKSLIIGSRICHQIDDRSFHFGIRKFPLCTRCTALYSALPMGILVSIFVTPPLYVSIILLAPMLVDGIVTGGLFGYAVSAIIFSFI